MGIQAYPADPDNYLNFRLFQPETSTPVQPDLGYPVARPVANL